MCRHADEETVRAVAARSGADFGTALNVLSALDAHLRGTGRPAVTDADARRLGFASQADMRGEEW